MTGPALQSPADAVAAVATIDFVPTVLRLVCEMTGMGWSAVAHVGDEWWTACAVHDGIGFGLQPGSQIEVDTTLCVEVKRTLTPIVIDHVAADPSFADHLVPRKYGFQSYVSVPIVLAGGEYFGNLCALDPRPHPISRDRTASMFEAFASLIAAYLEVERQRDKAQASLLLQMRARGGERVQAEG